MNLPAVHRLVRKLTEVLGQPALESQAPKLAQDFAALCRQTGHRLEQCAAMLEAGNDLQAMQLAEAQPPLLDLITLLDFRQASDWRNYCQARGLPLPEPFEAKSIRLLNAAYAKGTALNPQLYREYRQAILRKQEEQGIAVLRVLLRLNPGDTNAATELQRLEAHILETRLARLGEAVRAADGDAVCRQVQEIGTLGLSLAPDGEVWREAQRLRCLTWLRAIEQLRAAGDWREAPAYLEGIREVAATHNLQFSAAHQAALASAEAWIQRERDAVVADQNFHRTLKEVEVLLGESEQRQLTPWQASLAQVRNDLEALLKKRLELERFGRKVPESLLDRLDRMTALLRSSSKRRARTRRNAVLAALGLVLLGALIGLAIYTSHRRTRDVAEELRRLREARQAMALDKLVREIREQGGGQTNRPALWAELALAVAAVEKEYALKRQVEGLLGELRATASNGFTGSPEAIARRHAAATNQAAQLAPDLQPAVSLALGDFQNRWERYLSERRTARDAEIERTLRPAEQRARDELAYDKGAEAVRRSLGQLEPTLAELRQTTNATLPELQPAQALAQRVEILQRQCDGFARALQEWDAVQATLRSPTGLAAYLDALRRLGQSEFAATDDARHATELLALAPTETGLLKALLLPPELAAQPTLTNVPRLRLYPGEPIPEETAKFRTIRDSAHLFTLFRNHAIKLGVDEAPGRVLYSRGKVEYRGTSSPQGLIYDPKEHPDALRFEKISFYSGIWRVLLTNEPCFEAAICDRAGITDLVDSSNGRYTRSLVEALQVLNEDRVTSALFRAWVAVRLHEMLAARPAEWDLPWCPTLREHQRRLAQLRVEEIRDGDWLVPNVAAKSQKALDDFFAQAARVPYLKQRDFLHGLAERAFGAGFVFAGYVDVAGHPRLRTGMTDSNALWGWSAPTHQPRLLFRSTPGDDSPKRIEEPVPFTPLFSFGADRTALKRQALAAAGLSAADPAATAWLPPLFTVPAD